jgi:replicative DNA helicase
MTAAVRHTDEDQLLSLLGTEEGIAAAVRVRPDPALVDDPDARETLAWVLAHYDKHGKPPTPTEVIEELGWDEIAEPESDVSMEVVADRLVQRRARKRLLRASKAAAGLPDQLEAARLLNEETAKILADSARTGDSSVSTREIGRAIRAYLEARDQPWEEAPSFGFEQVDAEYGGLRPGELYVYAGNSGRYKSWLLLRSAIETFYRGHSVLFVTGELSVQEQIERMLAMIGGFCWPQFRKRGGEALPPKDLDRLWDIENWLTEQPHQLRFAHASDFMTAAPAVQAAADMGASVLYVDQLYNLVPALKVGDSNYERFGQIAKELKDGAQARDLAVVAAAQLNREGESVKSLRNLSAAQIGDSYRIIQVADLAFGLFANRDMRQQNVLQVTSGLKNRAFRLLEFEVKVKLDEYSNFDWVDTLKDDE